MRQTGEERRWEESEREGGSLEKNREECSGEESQERRGPKERASLGCSQNQKKASEMKV